MDARQARRQTARQDQEGQSLTPSAINQALAARADAARARLRRERPELGTNQLTAAELVAMDEHRVAELVAIDHFGWRLVNPAQRIFETPPAARGVAYSTRPFLPCTNANDDRLALRFVRRRHSHLLGSLATALLDLARARTAGSTGAPIHPLMVSVYAHTGDYCRALLLIASTTWQADQARPERGNPTQPQHKETAHGVEPTSPPINTAAPATAEAARSQRSEGAGVAAPAPHASSPQKS